MSAAKGTRPPAAGIGRPKGKPNKITKDIREMIAAALDEVGGVWYLVKQANANPKAFMSLVGRIVPAQIEATIKRELPEMTRDELFALLNSVRSARVIEHDSGEAVRQLPSISAPKNSKVGATHTNTH